MSLRSLMLAVTGALAFSQFLPYTHPQIGHLRYGTALPTVSTFEMKGGNTGWEQHPLAFWMLVALCVVYFSDIHEGSTWRRWGHWLLLPAVFLCVAPAAAIQPGGGIGIACLAVTGYAVYRYRKELKTAAAPPPPAAPYGTYGPGGS